MDVAVSGGGERVVRDLGNRLGLVRDYGRGSALLVSSARRNLSRETLDWAFKLSSWTGGRGRIGRGEKEGGARRSP